MLENKKPIKIKVNNRVYKIETKNLEKKDLFGYVDYIESRIVLASNTIKDIVILESTLVHELTHAFLFENGHTSPRFNNEQICNFLGAYAENIIKIKNKVFSFWGIKQ